MEEQVAEFRPEETAEAIIGVIIGVIGGGGISWISLWQMQWAINNAPALMTVFSVGAGIAFAGVFSFTGAAMMYSAIEWMTTDKTAEQIIDDVKDTRDAES